MKLHRNIKIFVNYFLGPSLFIWLSWSIYRQIQQQPNLEQAWRNIRDSFNSPMIWNLVLVILLMMINWSIEAIKWKIAVRSIQQVSFWKAFKAILSGVSFSVSTPNRVGEYLGRVLYMDEGNRLKTISITIVASISQLIITLLMGCIGLIILRPAIESNGLVSSLWMKAIIYGVITIIIVLTLFYFRLSWLIRWVDRFPGSSRFAYLVRALENFDATLLLRLLSLSAIRFTVFIAQYYLLFQLFAVDISAVQAFWGVSVSFLVMAVIPTFAIAELAQRGYIVKTIIALYSANKAGIIFATAGIWFINLIIPAIAGSLLILSIRKIIKNKNERI
ncbi:MAG TPA: lysylphosphatidylglycerol synthase domain-containing protein [Chitinophagaceae bacterium]